MVRYGAGSEAPARVAVRSPTPAREGVSFCLVLFGAGRTDEASRQRRAASSVVAGLWLTSDS